MKRIISIVLITAVFFVCMDKAYGGETETQLLTKKENIAQPFSLLRSGDCTNECTLKFESALCTKPQKDYLPFQSRMEFGTINISPYEAMDVFNLRLFKPLSRNVSAVWFIDSSYGTSTSGLGHEYIATGLGLTKKFGRRH